MLYTRSLLMTTLLLASGCGARTVGDDYRVDFDAGDVPTVDTPVIDTPVIDTPVIDTPPMCPPGLASCGGFCTDLRSDRNNCGRCGVACGSRASCVSGTCVEVLCAGGLTFCSGTCVDLGSDRNNCGRCGNVCGVLGSCQGGFCRNTITCPAGLATCNGTCVDLASDAANCGRCGTQCPFGSVCSASMCRMACPPPTVLCGSACVNLVTDPMNCGACGSACGPGMACQMGVCFRVTMTGTSFEIGTLATSNCNAVEHNTVTGDDRGGIAVGPTEVFYTGDTRTVGFDLDTLSPTAMAPTRYDGIFGETSVPVALTLGSNRAPLDERTSIIDTAIAINPDATLGTLTALSSTLFLDRAMPAGSVGIFGGALRLIVTAGSRAWVIDGPMAAVTELAITPIGEHQACESWAFWGVNEFFEGAPWVAYVRDSRTIVRQNLLTGATRTVASFSNLSDMCSFTVSPSRSRWYFHHEGTSQFRSGDETIGYCDARFLRP